MMTYGSRNVSMVQYGAVAAGNCYCGKW